LEDGENPPADRLDKDYVMQPSHPRRCVTCNKTHDYILESVYTGERELEFDECKECLLKKWFGSINAKI